MMAVANRDAAYREKSAEIEDLVVRMAERKPPMGVSANPGSAGQSGP